MNFSALLTQRQSHELIKEITQKYGLTLTDFLEEAAAEKLARQSELGFKILTKLGLLIEDAKAKAFEAERKHPYWEAFDDDTLKRQIEAAFLWANYFDWETATNGTIKEQTDDELAERLKKFGLM